ncbi:plectin-like [Helianthus annuus]|uniref:plectin-like n=1 Tax=Helianthus annuus TaxID=4232 RepID=UPI001652F881|nr:plectin-like [Helianthus annuus]
MEDYQALGRKEEEAARLRAEVEDWNEKLSDERKSWKVSWAKQNETLFRVRQELINVKAANAALRKEKAAAETVAGKAREAEARAVKALEESKEVGVRAAKALEEANEREGRVSKALEEANADRTRLNRIAEVQSREAKLAEVNACVTEAEKRASEAAEARDSLTSSFNQLEADHDRAVAYHRPPWSVLQGDDVSNNPSFCKEILGGVGTPFEVNRARALPRELRVNQLSSMLVGSSIVANAIMEDYQALGRKEEEAARLRAEVEELELINVKAANAALRKEKAAAETVAGKAREAEARAVKALEESKEVGVRAAKALEEANEREGRVSKALEEANADRTRLNQIVGSLQI